MISRRISKSGFPQLRSLHRANGFGGGAYGPPILSLTFFTLCMTKNRLSTRQSPAVDIAQYINRRMNAHAEMRGRFLSQRREPRAVRREGARHSPERAHGKARAAQPLAAEYPERERGRVKGSALARPNMVRYNVTIPTHLRAP